MPILLEHKSSSSANPIQFPCTTESWDFFSCVVYIRLKQAEVACTFKTEILFCERIKSENMDCGSFKIWMFPKIVVPQNGCFIMENFIKMDDLGGFPIFLETPIFASQELCESSIWIFHGTPQLFNKRPGDVEEVAFSNTRNVRSSGAKWCTLNFKKSPTGPFLNGPRRKPEYLIALQVATYLRVSWDSVPLNF